MAESRIVDARQLAISITRTTNSKRNRAIAEKTERLDRQIRHGALAQVTAGSLAGHFGKNVQKLALQLTEVNLVHTYSSDVHNAKTRPFLFNKGLDYLQKRNAMTL